MTIFLFFLYKFIYHTTNEEYRKEVPNRISMKPGNVCQRSTRYHSFKMKKMQI